MRLFDAYEGEPIAAGERSLAYRLTLRAPDRTLTSAEVKERVDSISATLLGHGLVLRAAANG